VIREGDVLHTRNVLRAIGPDRADRLQAAGLAVFRRYFADVDRQLDGLLEILARRENAPDHRTHAVAVDIAERWDAAPDADERALLDGIERDLDPDGKAPHVFDALRRRGAEERPLVETASSGEGETASRER